MADQQHTPSRGLCSLALPPRLSRGFPVSRKRSSRPPTKKSSRPQRTSLRLNLNRGRPIFWRNERRPIMKNGRSYRFRPSRRFDALG